MSNTENPVDELNNPVKASVSQSQDLVAKRERDEAPKAMWPRTTLSTPIHYWIGVVAPFWSNWLSTTFHRHHRGTEETFHDGIHARARICRITRPSHDSLQPYEPYEIARPGSMAYVHPWFFPNAAHCHILGSPKITSQGWIVPGWPHEGTLCPSTSSTTMSCF